MNTRIFTCMPGRVYSIVCAVFLVLLSGCATEFVPFASRPSDDHQTYFSSLQRAGLGESALVRQWGEASLASMNVPVPVSLPYQETGYFDTTRPEAVSFLFSVLRGQRVEVRLESQESDGTRIFADLYRIDQTSSPQHIHVASKGYSSSYLEFESRKDGSYLLRIQPELLKGGRFTLRITASSSLGFPVEGGSVRDVISVFGDPRDGGSRQHEGVDIQAPRGTAVLAPVRGYITRVQTTKIGGKVVWLYDRRNSRSLYFAHLDSQKVRPGTWVEPGDVLGTVGNTGNAINTPPHLHFSIYPDGGRALDPYHFIFDPDSIPSQTLVDLSLVGTWMRPYSDGIPYYPGFAETPGTAGTLERDVPLLVRGGSGTLLRVSLPDGTPAYVGQDGVVPADRPVRTAVLEEEYPVFEYPHRNAAMIGSTPAGQELPVYGSFGQYLLVGNADGKSGWIEQRES